MFLLGVFKRTLSIYNKSVIWPVKSYTGEGLTSFEKVKKPVWRPKTKHLNKFRSMLFTKMKTNWFILEL